MRLKVIACDVLTREVCYCAARSPHITDIEFTEKGAHEDADYLRNLIQRKINAAEGKNPPFDAVCLGYGLCGNAVNGLKAGSLPLVIPRAHDCCTLFLGSKQRFAEHFGENPSRGFSSAGYMERGESYVHDASLTAVNTGYGQSYEDLLEQYGEENANYLWETLHPGGIGNDDDTVVYIEIPEFSHLGHCDECRREAEKAGKTFICLEGSMQIIENLVMGSWDKDMFCIVKPGETVAGVYDMDRVIRAEKKS